MHVSVDASRCQGHGQCVMSAPDVFGADVQGFAVVLLEDIPAKLESAVGVAVLRCPEQAINTR